MHMTKCMHACSHGMINKIMVSHSINTGIWISTNSLKHATDGESVKQKWEQVALSTAKIDRALFLEIAKRSLKDSECPHNIVIIQFCLIYLYTDITVTEEFIAG